MNTDSDTKARLLRCAREEFTDKGFMKASLRNICKSAGVTTGALYFFFNDKDDLFRALTSDTVEMLFSLINEHFAQEMLADVSDTAEDVSDTLYAVQKMYEQRDDIILLLTKSQGSSLENIAEEFIQISKLHYLALAKSFFEKCADNNVDDAFIHWISQVQIEAFIYMIIHFDNANDAAVYMENVVRYMVGGWSSMFNI